ncbi:MAG: SDR family oxidoreductase [Chloroflexaceae bacterium]
MSLKGKVAIITGASSGLGYAVAHLFAREGAVVVANARRRDRLEWLVGDIAANGGQGISIPADVTDPAQVEHLMDQTLSLLGQIDILINSVGAVVKVAPVEQFNDSEWNTIWQTNMSSVFYTCRAVVPHMKGQRSGTIINVGSRVGKTAVPNIAPFCAAKFALTGFSQSLAQELRPFNIFVTTVFPGMINTNMQPFRPAAEVRRQLMSADDVAQAILWACSLPPSVRVDELPLMSRQLDM